MLYLSLHTTSFTFRPRLSVLKGLWFIHVIPGLLSLGQLMPPWLTAPSTKQYWLPQNKKYVIQKFFFSPVTVKKIGIYESWPQIKSRIRGMIKNAWGLGESFASQNFFELRRDQGFKTRECRHEMKALLPFLTPRRNSDFHLHLSDWKEM